jgi:hypothetical protein
LQRLDLEYHMPNVRPRKLEEDKQKAFIEDYDKILNSLSNDEVMLFADAVHPTHAALLGAGQACDRTDERARAHRYSRRDQRPEEARTTATTGDRPHPKRRRTNCHYYENITDQSQSRPGGDDHRRRQVVWALAVSVPSRFAFRCSNVVGPILLSRLDSLAYALPCQRLADPLAGICA